MIAYSHDLNKDTTIGEIISKGKNLLIYESFRGVYPPDQSKILVANSYWQTLDKYPHKNIEKCKDWCQ
jgi:hypothetical protein